MAVVITNVNASVAQNALFCNDRSMNTAMLAQANQLPQTVLSLLQ